LQFLETNVIIKVAKMIIRVQNIFHVLNNVIFNTVCKYITDPTLCAVETLLFQACNCKYSV